MPFNSHIYDRTGLDSFRFEWLPFTLTLLIGVLGYVLKDINDTLSVMSYLVCSGGCAWLTFKDFKIWESPGRFVGELKLDVDEFDFNGERINTDDILDLRVYIGKSRGEYTGHRYGPLYSSGTGSFIELKTKNFKRSYNFMWRSDSQLKELRPVVEGLYKKHIFVKEYFHGERTYLFEELSYEEIQAFKKKYDVWGDYK